MAEEGLHVVLGVGGNLGRSVARSLVDRGLRVRGVSRSEGRDLPPGVEHRTADALDADSMRSAVEGASVLYHCMGAGYSMWATHLPLMMRSVIEAAAEQGSGTRVVYADNLYCYGKEGALRGPLTEDTPYLADGTKGKVRAELVRTLLKAHEDGRLQSAVGHASDFYGPEATHSIFHFFAFPQIVKGGKVKMLADLDRLHSVIYLPDYAQALVELGVSDAAFGSTWILPHGEAMTLRRFLELCFEEAGIDPAGRIGRLPKAGLTVGSLISRDMREVKEVMYQFQVDWTVDSSRYEEAFSFRPTPVREAIARTLAWYREQAR